MYADFDAPLIYAGVAVLAPQDPGMGRGHATLRQKAGRWDSAPPMFDGVLNNEYSWGPHDWVGHMEDHHHTIQ